MKALVFLVTGFFVAAVAVVGAVDLVELPRRTPTETSANAPRRISSSELGRHGSASDCWIAVGDGVYDVTRYIDEHPAPTRTIVDACGTDATVSFETKNRGRSHSSAARKLLETMRVGDYAR